MPASAGLGNVRCLGPADPALPAEFGLIWSNPPIRIGKQALHELLGTWLGRLAAGAAAYLVVQRNLGSDSLQRWLAAAGWDASRFAAQGRLPGAAGAAVTRQLGMTEVKRLNRGWRRRTQAEISLLLDSVGQPFNVGSIIRSAAAFGVQQIWLCGDTAQPGHPSARKTSLGTDRLLSFGHAQTAALGAQAARAAGFRVVAVELAGGRRAAARGRPVRRRLPGPGQRGSRLLGRAAGGRRPRRLHPSGRQGRLAERRGRGRDRAGRSAPPRMGGPAGPGSGRGLAACNPVGVPSGFLDHPRPLAIAHRGGASHFPENSWKAFEHAVRLGYAYLETDAHATADGTVVAFHDKTLDRVTDSAGAIAKLTAAQVAAARIDGTEPIPLLADLLTSWPAHRFNIDVKDEPVIGPLIGVLRATNAWDRVCLTSFSGRRLSATRALLPRPVCMATPPAAVGAIKAGTPASVLAARFGRQSIQCAQVPVQVATGLFIRRAHAAGTAGARVDGERPGDDDDPA